jgi:hypothetical protein
MTVAYLVGIVLACSVSLAARAVGFDRDRAFYPTVLIVVASYYVLFAAIASSPSAILAESATMTVFLILAVIGFKGSRWLLVVGLAGHGLFDIVHGRIIDNPGVPAWWPAFCMAYDLVAAGCFAWLSRPATTLPPPQ